MKYLLPALCATLLLSQTSGMCASGKTADDVPVMSIPVSARATALGDAVYASGREAVRYNPAYLGALEIGSMYATFGALPYSKQFSNAYVQLPLNIWQLGIGAGVSDIRASYDTYTGPDDDATSASVSQSLVTLGAGKRLSEDYLVGLSYNALVDQIAGSSTMGSQINAGVGYLASHRIRLGLVARNLFSTAASVYDILPVTINIGGNWTPNLMLPCQMLSTDNNLYVSLQKTASDDMSYSAGWESTFYRTVSVRFGFDKSYLTTGVGVRYKLLDLDIATSIKETGFLYFTTLRYRFGYTAAETVANATEGAARAEERKATVKAIDKTITGIEYAVKGWDQFKAAKYSSALDSFNKALLSDPSNELAQDGQKKAQMKLDESRAQNGLEYHLEEGKKAFIAKDYINADKNYSTAYTLDNTSPDAIEGIRITVQAVDWEIGKYLEGGTTEQFGHRGNITTDDAIAISQSGSFKFMVSAMDLMRVKKFAEAFDELQNIMPKDNVVVKQYNSALAKTRAREMDQTYAKASNYAADGYFQQAVNLLESMYGLMGLTPEEKKKVDEACTLFEFRGRMTSRDSLQDAERLISENKFIEASIYLDRAINSGYDIDAAKKLIESASKGIEKQKAQVKPVDVKQVASLESKAADLYGKRKFTECRTYLVKILVLDPKNANAQRYLNNVDYFLTYGDKQ